MHPISSAQKENILSLASHGHSTCSIAKKTGLGKSTVIRTLHNILPNHQMPSSGHPSKLSSRAQHAILSQITMGKVSNAVQATKYINTIVPHPVSSQTVRNVLKKHSFKAVTKKKKPLLSAMHRKKCLAFALKYKEWTRWEGGGVEVGGGGVDLKGGSGDCEVWGRKDYGMGMYGLGGCRTTCRG